MLELTGTQARQAVERYLELAGLLRGTRDHRDYEIAKRRLRRRIDCHAPVWPLTYEATMRIVADYVGV